MDICRLETEGAVFSDIESADEEVWRVLCEERLPAFVPIHIVESLKNLNVRQVGTSREAEIQKGEEYFVMSHKVWYLCLVASCLFMQQKVAALRCLFQGPAPTTAQYTADTFSDIEVLLALMKECHFLPPALHISCEPLLSSALWQRKSETFTLLAEFLAKISHLQISSRSTYANPSTSPIGAEAFPFILEALFLANTGEPVLTHLCVVGEESFMSDAVSILADFFSPRGGVQPLHAHSPLTTQYEQLQQLWIRVRNCSDFVSQPEPHTGLRMIIEHQKSLQVLTLIGWDREICDVCREYDLMMETVSSLFRSPQFSKLKLDMGIHHSTDEDSVTLHNLLLGFLSSPVQGQELVIAGTHGIAIFLDEHSGYLRHANGTVARDVVGSKHMHILCEMGSTWVNSFFSDYLTYYPYQSLGELTLEDVEEISDGLLAGIASTPLRVLQFFRMDFMSDVSVAAVANLFAMPSLYMLSLPAIALTDRPQVNLNPHTPSVWERLVNAVTMGLQKQQSIAHLTVLDLSANGLHNVKTASLETMFRTLFSLCQLSDLCLDLQENKFTSSQLELFHQTWIEVTGGQRLARLGVLKQNDNHLVSEDIVLKLQKMAVQIS